MGCTVQPTGKECGMFRKMYLIDGVHTKKNWERRKVFGEYPGAVFQCVEIRSGASGSQAGVR